MNKWREGLEISEEADAYIRTMVDSFLSRNPRLPGYDTDDYYQEARIAYCFALDTWSERRNTCLKTYAVTCIRNRLNGIYRDHIRSCVEVPFEDMSCFTTETEAFDSAKVWNPDAMDFSIDVAYVLGYLKKLLKSERRGDAIAAEAVLDGMESRTNFMAVANRHGVSRQYVKTCTNKLRGKLMDQPRIRDFFDAYGCAKGAVT